MLSRLRLKRDNVQCFSCVSMSELSSKKCVPCKGGAVPLKRGDSESLLRQLKDWNLDESAFIISKGYVFKNFVEAMVFINKVADIAEEERHHPDMHISYNKVQLTLTTHAIGGLSENDFIVAAKIDSLK